EPCDYWRRSADCGALAHRSGLRADGRRYRRGQHLSALHRVVFAMVRSIRAKTGRPDLLDGVAWRIGARLACWRHIHDGSQLEDRPSRTTGRVLHDGHAGVAAAPARARLRYSLRVPNPPSAQRSPTTGLLLGLLITLAAIVAYSAYTTVQLSGLRKLESDLVDRNRKESLQLVRLQNDLNTVALAMRDMLDASGPYPLIAWEAQFARVRTDLDSALRLEEEYAEVHRTPEQRQYLRQQLA